ncbi:tyrosine-type recombinase/integrase [Microbispora catharanthi]|uniref:Tyrosine-type recombinase/integrase n=2 Tax=Microbispora catharanthi TaxID=1712871 RepID=A0A5N6BZ49_9ACTN|nr:tyrosine-type recombinase/integrase [Microbispora catharanthi]
MREGLHRPRRPVPEAYGRRHRLSATQGPESADPPMPTRAASDPPRAQEAPGCRTRGAGELWEDHELLFPTRRGRPMGRSEDYKMWKALLKQAGVREARLHDARHTAGTLLVEQGVHIRVVQEILGHARVTTTERYTHIASPQVKDASERMGAALWGED